MTATAARRRFTPIHRVVHEQRAYADRRGPSGKSDSDPIAGAGAAGRAAQSRWRGGAARKYLATSWAVRKLLSHRAGRVLSLKVERGAYVWRHFPEGVEILQRPLRERPLESLRPSLRDFPFHRRRGRSSSWRPRFPASASTTGFPGPSPVPSRPCCEAVRQRDSASCRSRNARAERSRHPEGEDRPEWPLNAPSICWTRSCTWRRSRAESPQLEGVVRLPPPAGPDRFRCYFTLHAELALRTFADEMGWARARHLPRQNRAFAGRAPYPAEKIMTCCARNASSCRPCWAGIIRVASEKADLVW